ncbi:MAG: gliding motility-associated C-terminal domain-containing protein [Sphingobacteriales bacterium]|nr:gliding motility-associated C-terminal domain-containing protein [Sphingobacteriales bacterium]
MNSRYITLTPNLYRCIHQYLLLISLCLIAYQTTAQCSGSVGDPVINQDFGTNSYQLPFGKTSYQPVGGCPNDPGTYTIANFLFGCGPRSWVQMVGDHTPNDNNGNYMAVNASSTPGTVYQDTAKSLCGNTTYVFGIWISALMTKYACDGYPIPPNVKFAIKDISGKILVQDSTGNLPLVTEWQWKHYTLSLTAGPVPSDLIISVTTNPPRGCGAAFAIDDITLSPCSPSTISASINGGIDTVDVCADYTDVWNIKANYTPGFNNPVVQWQSSTDAGKSWTDIPGATTVNYTVPHRLSGVIDYRICIAENGNINSLNCRVASNIIHTGVYPLPPYVAPQNIQGCSGKDYYFPPPDPYAFTGFWTGPNGFNAPSTNAVIPAIQYKDTGMYILKNIFDHGCVRFDTFYLKVAPGTSLTVQPAHAICEGQSEILQASATDEVSYLWTPNNGLSDNTIANPVASPSSWEIYKVIITNKYGCQDSAYVRVDVYEKAVADAGPDKAILTGDTATLNGTVKGAEINYYWTPNLSITNTGIEKPLVFPAQTSMYTLHVESNVGCGASTDDVIVKVYNDFYIANAFTPNNDGLNDRLHVITFDKYKLVKFHIYNRWGQVVYTPAVNDDGWDGTYKGLEQPSGIYLYDLEMVTPKGKKIIRKGTINLIR